MCFRNPLKWTRPPGAVDGSTETPFAYPRVLDQFLRQSRTAILDRDRHAFGRDRRRGDRHFSLAALRHRLEAVLERADEIRRDEGRPADHAVEGPVLDVEREPLVRARHQQLSAGADDAQHFGRRDHCRIVLCVPGGEQDDTSSRGALTQVLDLGQGRGRGLLEKKVKPGRDTVARNRMARARRRGDRDEPADRRGPRPGQPAEL